MATIISQSVSGKKQKIIVVGGPTASGKSALAIEIARIFNGEIIGADSMQIYRRMDIGTGKLSREEMQGIPHKMIDIIEPDQEYSAGAYVKDCKTEIHNTALAGRLPILVGGTGLYINALLKGYSFGAIVRDETYRNLLKQRAEESGHQALYEELCSVDPVSAAKISATDIKRIIRALEIFYVSGVPKSEKLDANESNYDCLFLAIKTDRQSLYNSIEKRVDKMLFDGLIEEVKTLDLPRGCQSMNAIGYKETAQYIDGKINLKQLAELIKINTRHYAKRQITFFKNVFSDVQWVQPQDFAAIKKMIDSFMQIN